MAGLTNWDVRVVRASNLEVLAYVPRWEKIDIQDSLSDVGSGKLEMDFNDPFFSTFEADNLYSLLTGPFAIQILRNSTLVFTFLVEDAQIERTGFKQPVTISGRGIGASLEWGIVIPEGYSNSPSGNTDSGIRPKYFDRLFKGYEYSARVATRANIASVTYANGTTATANFPGAGATLTSTINGNINSVSPIDGLTDLIVGDNILVKNQTNTNHNGVYVISQLGNLDSDPQEPFKLTRVTECDGSPSMDDLAVGSQCFVAEGSDYYAVSSSTITVGTGSKTFAVANTGSFIVGMRVKIIDSSKSSLMEGTITAVSVNTSVTVSVLLTNGSGSYSSWDLEATQKQSAFTLATTPSASNQVGSQPITFSAATQVYTGLSAFYCMFQECDTGFEYKTDKGPSFGTDNQSYGRGGSQNSVSWPLSLESRFSTYRGLTDSKGQMPKDGGAFTLPVGKNMLETLRSICEQTLCDWRVSPSGEIKIVKKRAFDRNNVFQNTSPFGTDRTIGSDALLISLPATTQSTTQSSMKELKTVVYGSDKVGIERQESTSTVSVYGRREGYFENTSETAPAVRNITAVGLTTLSRSSFSVDPNITERPNLIAWLSFQVGDWVLVENAIGNFTTRVINGITASVSNSGSEQIQVNLDEVLNSLPVDLQLVTGYGTSQARNLAVFSEQTSIKIPAINSTAVSATANVSGTSNRAVVSWSAPSIGSPTSYVAQTYRVTDSKELVGADRLNGIATITTDGVLTGAVVGSLIRISGVGANFDSSLEKILSVSGDTIKYANQGADEGAGWSGVATVELFGEIYSISVPSTQTTASFENLATPGGTYYSTITPVNSNGQLGNPSSPVSFTASTDDQVVTAGALRSTGYSENTSGWMIKANGDAYFNGTTIVRGAIYAGTGVIGSTTAGGNGFTITAGKITSGTSSTAVGISTGVATSGWSFWAGSTNEAIAPFRVKNDGTLVATSATITGAITATSGTFNGRLTAGDIYIPSAASPVFSVTDAGAMTATSGRIGPFTLSSSGLTNVTDTGYSESNFMRLQNYGDMTIFSNPSSGAHSGAFHRTDVFGENITISRHTNKANMLSGTGLAYPYVALGSFTNAEMELTIVTASGTNAFRAHSNGNVSASGTVTAPNFSGSLSGSLSGSVSATSVSSSGDITVNSADFRRLGSNMTAFASGGVDARWGSTVDGGFLRKLASSSLRYKTDITEVTNPLLDPKKLLDVNIVQYKYKDGVLAEDDPANGEYLVGFIAEDMYEKYKIGATLDDQGRPEAWSYLTLIPAMMSLIKDLNARITELE